MFKTKQKGTKMPKNWFARDLQSDNCFVQITKSCSRGAISNEKGNFIRPWTVKKKVDKNRLIAWSLYGNFFRIQSNWWQKKLENVLNCFLPKFCKTLIVYSLAHIISLYFFGMIMSRTIMLLSFCLHILSRWLAWQSVRDSGKCIRSKDFCLPPNY